MGTHDGHGTLVVVCFDFQHLCVTARQAKDAVRTELVGLHQEIEDSLDEERNLLMFRVKVVVWFLRRFKVSGCVRKLVPRVCVCVCV
jgi:galactose-1-phosphate uridylyltransferase